MTLALYAIFFLSGVAALVFETLWFHQAGLAFGNSIWASSLVLSSFMLGLALGNGIAARIGDRLKTAVRAYAWLEVAIGVGGLALVVGLPAVAPALGTVFEPLSRSAFSLNAARLLSGFLFMLVPATAMGATLPILMKALSGRERSFGSALGRLYGCNALGAVVGAVAGELALIEWIGVRGTGMVAASCNGLAAIGALAVARELERAPRGRAEATQRSRIDLRAGSLLAAAMLSGFLLLALEVVWFRFLQLFVAGTSLAFSFMLATVLLGIGCGGLLAGALLRRFEDAHARSAIVALLAGALCVAVYAAFPLVVAPYAKIVVQRPREVAWLTFALSFPVSTLSGVLFTFLGSELSLRIRPEARAAGWLTLWNTIGAGLGSFVAGFVLLPSLGMEGSLQVLSLGYGAVAVLAVLGSTQTVRTQWPSLGGAAALFVATAVLFPAGLVQREFLPSAIARVARSGAWQLVDVREGLTETAVYLRNVLFGQPHYYELMTNGYAMSGTHWGSRRYMKLYVYWPVAVAGPPKSALLISYGVGSTAKALTDTRSLERIDVVDISREILELSAIVYPDPADHPLEDPRVHVHVEDGRQYLLRTSRRYDLITGEPPPPKTAGVVNLYTREYFRLIHDRLNEGGVNTYWLPVHSMTERDAKSIVAAYCTVFTDCTLWGGWGLNFMLVGSRDGRFPRDERIFEAQWRDPVVGPELRALGIEVPEQLGALFMADAPALAELARGTPPLVDDFPKRLEAELPPTDGTIAVFGPWMDVAAARERFAASEAIARMWPAALRERTLAYFEIQELINARSVGAVVGSAGQRIAQLDQILRDTQLRTPVLWSLGANVDQIRVARAALAGGLRDPLLEATTRAAQALADRDYDAAADAFADASRRSPRTAPYLYFRVYALCLADRCNEASTVVDAAASWLPDGDEDFWSFMATRFGLSRADGSAS